MKLTKNNVKVVLSSKLNLDTRDIEITRVGVTRKNTRVQGEFGLTILSKEQHINCDIFSFDDDWEETLVTHIKWQLDILMILFYIAFRTTMYHIDKSISPEQ